MNNVTITWLGHACFRMEYKGWSLVVDPYADGSVPGLPPVRERAGAVYCTHGHFDHNAVKCVTLDGSAPPEDFSLATAVCPHDDAGGAKRGMNTIHAFTFGERRVVHMGDVGCALSGETLAPLRGCDVLLLPVGGFYTVDAAEAFALAKEIASRAVVPMHYRSDRPAFGFDVLGTAEEFTGRFPAESVHYLSTACFAVTDRAPAGVVVPRLAL